MFNTFNYSSNNSSHAQTTQSQGQFYDGQYTYYNMGFGQTQGMPHNYPSATYPNWSDVPYGTIPPYSPPTVATQQQYYSAGGLHHIPQYSTGGGDYGSVSAQTYSFSSGMPTSGYPASAGDGLSLNPTASGRQQGTGKHECPYCEQSFDRHSSLKTHLVSHTGQKDFICPFQSCGQAFGIKSNLTKHINNLHGEQGKQYLAFRKSEKMFVSQNPDGPAVESSSQSGSFRKWTTPMTGPTRDLFTNTTAEHYSSGSSRSRG